ncbi:MAG: hypothetical protein ACTSRS_18425 [Candidatus Helarchaeota archaeon]
MKRAKVSEETSNYKEAIGYYQLAAKLSKELGDFEREHEYSQKVDELKRRLQLLHKKFLKTKKIRMDESKLLELQEEEKKALQIAVIAEEERRWKDAIGMYKIVVQKNYEMGDIERAKAFEMKIFEIKKRESSFQ